MIISLFPPQRKLTLFISLLNAQSGKYNTRYYSSAVVSVYLLSINVVLWICLSVIMFDPRFVYTIRWLILANLASLQILPWPFSEKIGIECISGSTVNSLDQYVWIILILLYAVLRAIKKYWEHHLLLPHLRFFLKKKRGLELISLPHSLHEFKGKIYIFVIFY